jgi:hypothetical protein
MTAPRLAALRIGTLRLSGNGLAQLEARRLADALPSALERAARAWPGVAMPGPGGRPGLADRIARQIIEAAIARSQVEKVGQP